MKKPAARCLHAGHEHGEGERRAGVAREEPREHQQPAEALDGDDERGGDLRRGKAHLPHPGGRTRRAEREELLPAVRDHHDGEQLLPG